MNKTGNEVKKVWDLIKNIEVAMLTTQDSAGKLHSRPMATQKLEFDGSLWFFTEAASHKVDELHHQSQVNVTYVDSEKNRYVSICGKGQLVKDKVKAAEFWQPFLRAWFSKGVEDPELAMIRVQVERVDFWESPGSKVVQIFDILQAAISGEEPKTPEHKSVSLKD